jgi:hypothetical protein
MRGVRFFGVFAAVGTMFLSAPAFADPTTANSLQIGLGFRYGFEMNEGDLNLWGPGLGLDVGYTLPNAVYVGGLFEYFFGETIEEGNVKVKGNLWQLMAEGGYDLGLGPIFVLRPKLGAGFASTSGEFCAPDCRDDSSTDLAIAPGVKAMFFFPVLKLSADLRYDLVFAEETAKAVILTVGFGF